MRGRLQAPYSKLATSGAITQAKWQSYSLPDRKRRQTWKLSGPGRFGGVPADYQEIREENIARYGWDTAVLDLLGQLYSERTHFIFELIQNAEDAGATELAFELFPDRLELRHDGRPFTEADVRGLCGVGQSRKSGDLTSIGQFGIGFKSVYAYTRSPHIYSGDEHFRIENYVRPHATAPRPGDGTLFVFPFDHDDVPAAAAAGEISAALAALEPGILLFLASITRLRVGGAGVTASVLGRQAGPGAGTSRRVSLTRGRSPAQEWLIWHRPVGGLDAAGLRVEIAFRTEFRPDRPAGPRAAERVFPDREGDLPGVHRPGPLPDHAGPGQRARARPGQPGPGARDRRVAGRCAARTARGRAAEHRRADRAAAGGGALCARLDAAPAVRDGGRGRWPARSSIPAAGGGYRAAGELKLAGDAELPGLLDPSQLGALYGTAGPAWFADEAISETGTPGAVALPARAGRPGRGQRRGRRGAAVGAVPGRAAG